MYRPENWNEINPKPIGTSLGYGFTREDMYKHGEKCADAMLGALKQNARLEKHKYEQSICLIHNDGTVTIDTNPAYGWLVFIPDEEDGD